MIYNHIKVSCPIIVEGDPKVPFLIATILRCKVGHYSFFWIPPLTLDLYLIILSVEQGGIQYHFVLVFGMTRPGIESWSSGLLVNTQNIIPMIYI